MRPRTSWIAVSILALMLLTLVISRAWQTMSQSVDHSILEVQTRFVADEIRSSGADLAGQCDLSALVDRVVASQKWRAMFPYTYMKNGWGFTNVFLYGAKGKESFVYGISVGRSGLIGAGDDVISVWRWQRDD